MYSNVGYEGWQYEGHSTIFSLGIKEYKARDLKKSWEVYWVWFCLIPWIVYNMDINI